MGGRLVMGGGVAVGRVVAASDLAARLAETEVHPLVFAGRQAVLTTVGTKGGRRQILREM